MKIQNFFELLIFKFLLKFSNIRKAMIYFLCPNYEKLEFFNSRGYNLNNLKNWL